MTAYVGEIMSAIAFRGGRGGVHSIREKNVLTCEGWTTVRFPYRRAKDEKLDVFAAFGVRRNMTPGASETVSRLGVSACEYVNVTDKSAPIPIRRSFSYAVTDKRIGELTSLTHEHAVSRGSGTVPRVQCVADGEDALEKAMRDALPFAVFTNDIMHALQYLSLCCENLGIPGWKKEYATSRRIMFRHGGGSVADRIKRLYSKELAASETARGAIEYINKRRDNMRYGWLRKNGYYISSAHAEAAARILVARRCKQAGMHGRHHNAACVCALIAKIRSTV